MEVPSLRSLAPDILPSQQWFTTQRAFFPHAALLRQTFVHCAIFLTAASRRSLDRVSVPVWLIILSDQLLIVGLVGRYPTNYLIRRKTILQRPKSFISNPCELNIISGINQSFDWVSPAVRQVSYALRTRAPLGIATPFDLHVLSTPPAFVLSQDQTLRCRV